MIEKLFPQIYINIKSGKKYKTLVLQSRTILDTLEVVINGIQKYIILYQTIDDNGNNIDGIVHYSTQTEFEQKFKKIINQK